MVLVECGELQNKIRGPQFHNHIINVSEIGIDFSLEFRIISQEDFIMKLKNTAQTILSGLVFIIGFYMVIKFAGTSLPPVLSGIAFMIIGFLFLLKK